MILNLEEAIAKAYLEKLYQSNIISYHVMEEVKQTMLKLQNTYTRNNVA